MPVAHISQSTAQQVMFHAHQAVMQQRQEFNHANQQAQQSQLANLYARGLQQSPAHQMNTQQAESYLALAQFDAMANANMPAKREGPEASSGWQCNG